MSKSKKVNEKVEEVEEIEVKPEVEEVEEVVEIEKESRWEIVKRYLSKHKGKIIAGCVGVGAVAGGLYAANKYLTEDTQLLGDAVDEVADEFTDDQYGLLEDKQQLDDVNEGFVGNGESTETIDVDDVMVDDEKIELELKEEA